MSASASRLPVLPAVGNEAVASLIAGVLLSVRRSRHAMRTRSCGEAAWPCASQRRPGHRQENWNSNVKSTC